MKSCRLCRRIRFYKDGLYCPNHEPKKTSSIEEIASEYEVDISEAQTPRQSLDETTPGTGDVSGGSPPLGIRLGDLTMSKLVDPSGYTQVYSFTFNYNPLSKHVITEEIDNVYLSPEDEELMFWEAAVGKKKKKSIVKQMMFHSFPHQYEIFKKHFKRWEKDMNDLIPGSVIGYTVCIELTKAGVLHAHAIVYSRNNYVEMCSSTARTLWAKIAKGRVVAMKDAFGSVKSEKAWKQYVTKDNNKII